GDPLAVLEVGLASGHGLDVLGVGEGQLDDTLEEVPDGLPVHAGGLHGGVADALVGQPVSHLQEGVGLGWVGADLLAGAAAVGELADADDDLLFVDVEPGAAAVEDVHGREPRGARRPRGRRRSRTIYSAGSPVPAATDWGAEHRPGPDSLTGTAKAPARTTALAPPSRLPDRIGTRAPDLPIFMPCGWTTVHDDSLGSRYSRPVF